MQLNFNGISLGKSYVHHHYLIETDLDTKVARVVKYVGYPGKEGDWLFDITFRGKKGSSMKKKKQSEVKVMKTVKESEAEVI